MRSVLAAARLLWSRLEDLQAPLGFTARLAASMSVLLVAACATLSWVLVRHDLEEIRRGLIEHGRTISEYVADEAELSLLSGDTEELNRQGMTALDHHQGLLYYRFLDRRGQTLAAGGDLPAEPPGAAARRAPAGPFPVGESAWEFQAPVSTTTAAPQREEVGLAAAPGKSKPMEIGTVAIGVSTVPLEAVRRRVFFTAASLTALVTLAGIATAVLLAAAIGRPLRALAHAADAVARGAPSTVRVRTRDEVGALADSFNAMVLSLTASRKRLEEYNQTLEMRVRARTARLEGVNRQLQEANRLKSEFLAMVSHELRTPLNVIIGYSSMLDEGAAGPVTSRQRELLEAIQRYSRLQLDMITNILDYSRLASGKVSLQIERFAPGPALADVAALYDGRGNGKVSLRLEIEPNLPELRTDRVKLLEVVRNLLENAMKFTETGSVWLRARPAPSGLAVEVEDTGPGIAPDDLGAIFESFRQAGASRAGRTGGVGLGLSIVKQLVEILGGTISVSSTVGVGSTFQVEIPAEIAATPAAPT